MPKTYSKSIIVSVEDIDFNDHVNNLVYLQWALDISRDHWISQVDEEIRDKYFWVVRKHQIEYLKPAFEKDEIELLTFVQGIRGPFSERLVHVLREGEVIVKVSSNWCFLERASQKLRRVPEEIKELFL